MLRFQTDQTKSKGQTYIPNDVLKQLKEKCKESRVGQSPDEKERVSANQQDNEDENDETEKDPINVMESKDVIDVKDELQNIARSIQHTIV